jgi:hypothetical protein
VVPVGEAPELVHGLQYLPPTLLYVTGVGEGVGNGVGEGVVGKGVGSGVAVASFGHAQPPQSQE